jgi:hypothetical protein
MDFNLLKNGGKVLVVGGQNKSWESFRNHPQIVFFTGSQAEIARNLKNGNNFPSNTHAVIMSKFIGHAEAIKVREEARRKKMPIIGPLNDGQIAELLDNLTNHEPLSKQETLVTTTQPTPSVNSTPTAGRKVAKSGVVKQFVSENHRPEGTIGEEAQRLLPLAHAAGITTTTIGSLEQGVRELRTKLGLRVPRGSKPSKVVSISKTTAPTAPPVARQGVTAEKFTTLLGMLDEAVAGLGLIREEVVKLGQADSKLVQLRNLLKDL